ncbi:MAG: hypothetical protein RLZZ15_3323 [Verrucomicrobiota bacterium]|jgi:type 1 glutamine amidotransferase/quercetin dioxygenase-like cupin family protein
MHHRLLHHRLRSALALVVFATLAVAAAHAQPKIRVLIVDGQNNHQWATTTPLLRKILEDTGRFTVTVSTTPPGKPRPPAAPKNPTPAQSAAHAEATKKNAAESAAYLAQAPALWAAWRPRFSDYGVVVSNYNGEAWPAEVRAAFTAYVRAGGGFVSYHAANNSFPEWPDYNAMIGLGGWGGRDEKSGPYLRLRDGAWTRDPRPGRGGSHGAQHEFLVEASLPDHPILRGLPAKWMHAKDELYDSLRGPAENVTVLASAVSDKTKEHEPLLMVIPFGAGRVFHTALGHYTDAVHGLGFQVTFARGTEWAATGQVTLPAPAAAALPADRAAIREVKPAPAPPPPVARGDVFQNPAGNRLRILFDEAAYGGTELELAEITFVPNGDSGEHVHGATETFYVLEGELEHVVNGKSVKLTAGMIGTVRPPDKVRHKTGPAGARALVIWAPAGEAARIAARWQRVAP